MAWKRRGGRKVIIAPDGSDAWVPTKPQPDETLLRALARAHRRKRLLEDGKYRSAAEIAAAEGIGRSFVNRLLRLTLLAPEIQEAILDGRQPKGMQLEELARAVPMAWEEQRVLVVPAGDTGLGGKRGASISVGRTQTSPSRESRVAFASMRLDSDCRSPLQGWHVVPRGRQFVKPQSLDYAEYDRTAEVLSRFGSERTMNFETLGELHSPAY